MCFTHTPRVTNRLRLPTHQHLVRYWVFYKGNNPYIRIDETLLTECRVSWSSLAPKSFISDWRAATETCISLKQEISSKILYPWWMSRYWKLYITEAGNLLPDGWAATENCISLKQEISSKILYPWWMSRYWKLHITEAGNLLQNLVSLMDEPLLKNA